MIGEFLGILWCFEQLFLKSSSGRQQGTFGLSGTDLVTANNDAYINSDTIVDLFIKLKKEYSCIPLTVIMDNVHYQHSIKVNEQAKS